jgi:PPOX class probable FMN-dependent enzyme
MGVRENNADVDWRALLQNSLKQNVALPQSRYLQLATVDEHGLPDNRTVVYRGLDANEQIIIITDTRTQKWHQLEHCNDVAICWYFSDSREQFRLKGRASLIDVKHPHWQQCAIEQWNKLSDAARQQFLWGNPGEPRLDNMPLKASGGNSDNIPPEHFAVLLVDSHYVDYLTLRGQPQTRYVFTKGEHNWEYQAVIP